MVSCVGVDGCPRGWVVASRDRGRIVVSVVDDIASTLAGIDHVGIDMPIGLPATPGRAADRGARALLGPRRSSVFPAPARPLLECRSYAEANALSRTLFDVGMSVQTFHLMPKIREVDALAHTFTRGERDSRLAEVHPECSFHIAGGGPLGSKHTPAGIARRGAIIESIFGDVPPVPRGARLDDVLDACAALWSTERFSRGEHLTIPDDTTERDDHGTVMRIVA
jgi:predicted RNase H-like nuclease